MPDTLPAIRVLRAIAEGHSYGFDIMRETGLPSGTVYPILGRLLDDGLLSARWERSGTARARGKPPRRYYTITPPGRAALARALADLRSMALGFDPGADHA